MTVAAHALAVGGDMVEAVGYDFVFAGAAADRVFASFSVARAGVEEARDEVVARTAVERVAPAVAAEIVVPRAAEDYVSAGTAGKATGESAPLSVVAVLSQEQVLAGTAF